MQISFHKAGGCKAESADCNTGIILEVKELGFLNVRSVEALHVAQTVPCNEDQRALPYINP